MATSSSLGQGQASDSAGRQQLAGTRRRACKPKHTSFPCVVCGMVFPTQQAMVGHYNTHTERRHNPMGDGSFGLQGLPAVQGASATGRMPVAVVPNPSSFPYIHPLTNQVMMRAPSSFALPSPSIPFWMMVQHQIQVASQAQLIYDTMFHSCTVMSWPCNAAMAVVPSPLHAYTVNQPGVVQQADLTLRLGSSSSNSHGDKRKLLPSPEDGRHGKRPVVAMDCVSQSGEESNDADRLDLELHL